MTLNEVITEVDDLKPNQFDDAHKIRWINSVEGRIIEELVKRYVPDEPRHKLPQNGTESAESGTESAENEMESAENGTESAENETESTENKTGYGSSGDGEFPGYTEDDMDVELIARGTYADLYKYYLMSMIDLHNEEYDRYKNSSVLFNNAYQEFANYWVRTHKSNGIARFRH